MKKIRGLVLATFLGLAALTTLAAPASAKPADDVGVMNAACGTSAPDKDGSAWNATGGGANMRSGSSTTCAINSKATAGHRLDYHCYTVGNDGFTWTYLRDDTADPDKYGWVRDDLLSDPGSLVYCGF